MIDLVSQDDDECVVIDENIDGPNILNRKQTPQAEKDYAGGIVDKPSGSAKPTVLKEVTNYVENASRAGGGGNVSGSGSKVHLEN